MAADPSTRKQHVSFAKACAFLKKCCLQPERMRVLCSTKSRQEGNEKLIVAVEIAEGGPIVEVQEISMSEGWTGCRFSPCALWLSLTLARDRNRLASLAPLNSCETEHRKPRLLELGCGVGLAGFSAHSLGFDTTLTDCLEGHLRNLQAQALLRVVGHEEPQLCVRRLDWIDECCDDLDDLDRQSPENSSVANDWKQLEDSEEESFDLVVASDVLYEEHHAVLLPCVMKRWLRPGGIWIFTFAIRDADMLVRFVRKLFEVGIMSSCAETEANVADAFLLSWETACVPEQCDFCRSCSEACCGTSVKREKTALESNYTKVTLSFLESLIRGHEGGAIVLESRKPQTC